MEEFKMGNELYINQLTFEKEMEQIMDLKDEAVKVERLKELAERQQATIQSQIQKVMECENDLDYMHGKLYELMSDEEYEEYMDY